MEEIGIVTLVIIISNGLITYKGLKEYGFKHKFSFVVEAILHGKDYKRLITSGVLHVDWRHYAFNMISLFLFSQGLEKHIGLAAFLALYLISLLGGNLFALYIHKNHPDYSAIGASGAVCGVIFASIASFPGMDVGFILLPIRFPAWLFGLGYVLYSIYGIKSQKDNIGHEAHLGGGLVGLLVAIALNPTIVITNPLPIALILVPSILFLIMIMYKPHTLIVDNPFAKTKGLLTIEDKYNTEKVSKQVELDKILDKINKKGYDNLSQKDKDTLNKLSR